MSGRKIRGVMHPFEFLIDEDTKDLLDDLMTEYGDENRLMRIAIETLHKWHYGTEKEKDDFITKVSTKDSVASERFDLLREDVKKILAQSKHYVPVPTTNASTLDNEKQMQLTQEANEKILSKIDELNVKFSKQTASQEPKTNGTKHVTTEMSNEEILQLLKRMEQMETKITKEISEKSFAAARSSGPSRTGPLRDLGDGNAPKIHAVEGGAQPMDDVERPLLDDVLDTVIVSVEDNE